MKREEAEVCPHCMAENILQHDVEKDGYQVTCTNCGKKMMLCDACMHAEDNPERKCDWDKATNCFRKPTPKETVHENGAFYVDGGRIISRISNSLIDEPTSLIDGDTGTVLKHGNRDMCENWMRQAANSYIHGGFPENAEALRLIIYEKYGTLSTDQICTFMNYLANSLGKERVDELLSMNETELKTELDQLYKIGW